MKLIIYLIKTYALKKKLKQKYKKCDILFGCGG